MTENNKNQVKFEVLRKSIVDITMGVIYIGFGLFGLIYKYLKINLKGLDAFANGSAIFKVCCAAAVFYGAWRIYRGIKKDNY